MVLFRLLSRTRWSLAFSITVSYRSEEIYGAVLFRIGFVVLPAVEKELNGTVVLRYRFSNGVTDITPSLVDGTIWAPSPDKQQLPEGVERALVAIWYRSVLWCFRVKPCLPSFTRFVICNLWNLNTRKLLNNWLLTLSGLLLAMCNTN